MNSTVPSSRRLTPWASVLLVAAAAALGLAIVVVFEPGLAPGLPHEAGPGAWIGGM